MRQAHVLRQLLASKRSGNENWLATESWEYAGMFTYPVTLCDDDFMLFIHHVSRFPSIISLTFQVIVCSRRRGCVSSLMFPGDVILRSSRTLLQR